MTVLDTDRISAITTNGPEWHKKNISIRYLLHVACSKTRWGRALAAICKADAGALIASREYQYRFGRWKFANNPIWWMT